MPKRLPAHYGDETCAAAVVAGDHIFLSHHGGGFERGDAAHQTRAAFTSMRETLRSVGADITDLVQLNLYLKDVADFKAAREVFAEFFEPGRFPARTTLTSDFIDPRCLVQLDGVAYRREN